MFNEDHKPYFWEQQYLYSKILFILIKGMFKFKAKQIYSLKVICC